MTTSKTPHRAGAALKLPKANPALVTYANGIVTGMTGNPHFVTPTPTVAALKSAVADLQAAETAALARTKGSAAVRDEKRATAISLLQQTRSYVQGIADLNPEAAASIIQSAGLAVRKTAVRPPRVFAAKAGAVSGTVIVVAPSAGKRASYEWEYSTDGGKTWVVVPPTLQAKTSIAGLTPGWSIQFRYRAVIKTGAADWSQPITMALVQ